MTTVNIPQLAHAARPVVQIHDGKAITISTDVARVFGKRHDHVLRDIENLRKDLPAECVPNFGETSAIVPQPNGGTREIPAYHLTRDGFTLLAFGFTGKRAMAFKLAYIKAFNQMEAQLSGKTEPLPAPRQPELTMTDSLSESGISPDMIADIVASTTQNLVATLQQKRKLISWPEVIEALQNPKTDMQFSDLTALLHAALVRLQRNIGDEAYLAIERRAAKQGVSTLQASLNA